MYQLVFIENVISGAAHLWFFARRAHQK